MFFPCFLQFHVKKNHENPWPFKYSWHGKKKIDEKMSIIPYDGKPVNPCLWNKTSKFYLLLVIWRYRAGLRIVDVPRRVQIEAQEEEFPLKKGARKKK